VSELDADIHDMAMVVAAVRLAHRVALANDDRQPFVTIALALGEPPWMLPYATATVLIGAALRQPEPTEGEPK
jgi:hypothetical protein